MTRVLVGVFAISAVSALATASPAAALHSTQTEARSTAFLKFRDAASLERFVATTPGVERLHPELLWAFGDASVLASAAARESVGAVEGTLLPNRAFELPRVEIDASESAQTREATVVDKKVWGVVRMGAPDAWSVTRGEGVLVAVVDTGVDLKHPALEDRLEINAAEKNGQPGVDDDGNGYVDDVHGWDFFGGVADPDDDQGHGSHVGGTIAGEAQSEAFYGVAPGARLLAVKTHNARGASREDAVIKGILYAADRGAKVINCSWGGAPEAPDYSQVLYDAIEYAGRKGALLVAAAGNDGSDNDREATYPSNYNLGNVMAVASTTSRDGLSFFSNYGERTVHVAAPGSSVYSARAGGGYVSQSGTSMAAPHAAGAAALVYSKMGASATPEQVREILMSNAEALSSLRGRVKSGFLSLDFLKRD
jgi:subtilisin family serine protease